MPHVAQEQNCKGRVRWRRPCSVALKLPFFRPQPWTAGGLDSARVSLGRPQSPCVVYSIHGLVALLLRFSVVIDGAVEPPAAHTFERARLWHPHDVPPTCSSLLDRGAQDVICGPIFSWCFGLQRRGSMPQHGLGMACTWEEQRPSRGRSRSFDWSSSSSAPRGTCSPCAPRSAILSARAACGGRGSGFRRCWQATEVGWACHRRRIA